MPFQINNFEVKLEINTDHNKRGVEAVLRRLLSLPAEDMFFNSEIKSVELKKDE